MKREELFEKKRNLGPGGELASRTDSVVFVASSRWSDCFIAMKQLLDRDEAINTS